jgi:hypothetical protein
MAKKNKPQVPSLCTFCGHPATPVTWDDPFPRTLWAGPSKDRPLKVASCAACNNHSNESILKHFLIVLDSRFYPETISHFRKPAGRRDARTFQKMWAEIGGNLYLYLGEQVTAKFVKMFMGIRRHCLRKSWFFVPAEQFLLFKIDKHGDGYVARLLPLSVGVANPAGQVDPEFAAALEEPMQFKFRDFSYELFADDEDGMVMGLRYEREEFAGLGNRLYLLCFVPKARTATATQS